MDEENKYLELLEECADGIEKSRNKIEVLRSQGKYSDKDLAKTDLNLSIGLANLSSTKLNYYESKKLRNSLNKSSKRQRQLTWAIIIIGGLNLLFLLLKTISAI